MNRTTEERVSIIKLLNEWGYKEKHIRMITGDNQSYINRVLNGRLHAGTPIKKVDFDERTRQRIVAIDKFIKPEEIFASERQDAKYMKLLRIFLVEKEVIYKMYDFMAKAKINRLLNRKDIDPTKFDSTLLGIEREVFLDLIVDFI